jgi:hypothetical protein
MIADNTTEFTERDIFDSICHDLGVDFLPKDKARQCLLERIAREPAWLAVIPESLLDKLGIRHDRVFKDNEVRLATAIKARCERRILWP